MAASNKVIVSAVRPVDKRQIKSLIAARIRGGATRAEAIRAALTEIREDVKDVQLLERLDREFSREDARDAFDKKMRRVAAERSKLKQVTLTSGERKRLSKVLDSREGELKARLKTALTKIAAQYEKDVSTIARGYTEAKAYAKSLKAD